MANFNLAIVKTFKREGGEKITQTKSDRGGLTKFGISQASYPQLNIQALTEESAYNIYRSDYWNKVDGDNIVSQFVAESIFDFAVNSGVKTAIKLAQIAVDLSDNVDGVMGEQTLAKLNSADEKQFLANYTLAKIARYATICNSNQEQSKFLLGWINRSLGRV